MLSISSFLIGRRRRNRSRFGHHCHQRASPNSLKNKEQIIKQNPSMAVGHGKGMCKAAHPSGGIDSSNPRFQRGWRLHHHGGGVW
jgi:hypothetical protein